MTEGVGVLRSARLAVDDASAGWTRSAARPPSTRHRGLGDHEPAPDRDRARRHAKLRTETRGSHWREDHPDRDDAQWRVRLVTRLDDDGLLVTEHEPVPRDGPTRSRSGG